MASILKVDKIIPSTDTASIDLGKGQIIETLTGLCDGSSVEVSSGTYTLQNVTAAQSGSNTYTNLNGSVLSYVPPAGATRVVYEFTYTFSRTSEADPLGHHKFFIDSVEVTNARYNNGGNVFYSNPFTFKWVMNCNAGSAVAADGSFTSWTSAKELKIQVRQYGSGNAGNWHQTYYWDGSNSVQFHRPLLTITAMR